MNPKVPPNDSLLSSISNTRSIVNKLKDLQSLVYTKLFAIIGILEVWLADNIYNKILSFDYTIFRKNSNISNSSDFNFPDINGIYCQSTLQFSINYIVCDLIFNICLHCWAHPYIHGNVLDLLLMKKNIHSLVYNQAYLCHPIILTLLLRWLLSISPLANLHLIIPKVTTLVSVITYLILTLKLWLKCVSLCVYLQGH